MIAAVLFDLDQTLLDRKSSLAAFLVDQFERFKPRLGNVALGVWRTRFISLDAQGHVKKSLVYPQLLCEVGGDPAAGDALIEDYAQRFSTFARPFPDMENTLRALRGRSLRLGIITNGETAFQTRSIQALGLGALVDEILISECEGLRKPDRRLFLRAAQKLGAAPADCLFVGDNPAADILGAHAAGMRTAWLSGGAAWPEALAANPGAAIKALGEVLDLAR
jgi:putative hydrolase of the HAD superfamily